MTAVIVIGANYQAFANNRKLVWLLASCIELTDLCILATEEEATGVAKVFTEKKYVNQQVLKALIMQAVPSPRFLFFTASSA